MPFRLPSTGGVGRALLGLAVIAVIFYFFGRSLASNWSDLKSEDIDVQPALLVVSGLFFASDYLLRSVIWSDLLEHFAGRERPPLRQLTKIFLYSWIGRYVPGKVPYLIGRFYLGRWIGISSPALFGSLAYENVLLLVAAFAVASLTLVPSLAIESESVLLYLTLPVLALAGLVLLQPAVLKRALHLVQRLLGRERGEADWLLSTQRMAKVITLYAVTFCLSGVGFYLLIASLTPYSARYIPLAIGAIAVAYSLGLVSVFAPAGIGVREGILVGLLQFTMSVELAVVVSLAARAVATAVDLLLAGGCFAYDYSSGDRLLFAALRGRETAEVGVETPGAPEP